MKPTLTVFTPTYNRAHILHQCYESLKRQTCRDFQWLIIDDGSTDQTKALVESWIREPGQWMKIIYHYQENQGMHGAHNTAYKLIDTELNVCIDSDDYMADDAVEQIVSFWNEHGGDQYAGIVGLDAFPDGTVIGTELPSRLKAAALSDLYAKHRVKGDKKLVYRSDLTRLFPSYPIFPGEKYVPLSYKYLLIDQVYPLLIMNKVLCYVEYRPDGSSMNMIRQYKLNPRGFHFFRKLAMKHAPTVRERIRETIHYVSSSLMLKNYRFLAESPCKITTFFVAPLGLMLYFFIQNTNRTTTFKVRRREARR